MLCSLKKSYNIYSLIQSNGIHSSIILNGSRQIGNTMRKILGTSRKKKFHVSGAPNMPTPDIFSKGSFEGKSSVNSRRATVLNKLFMRHITDQMATGECSVLILGHGIEINRVKVAPDYKILRVYWTSRSTEDVQTILQKCAGILRHELSQLRVMGVVPIIQFVKEKHLVNIVELEKRLCSADFGEDYIPLDLADKYKTQLEISTSLNDDVKVKLKELDNQESQFTEDLPLPLMPQNVFGIPHADILDRIKKSMKKAKALHRFGDSKTVEKQILATGLNEDPMDLGDSKSQRAAFKEFLHKRQLLRLKAKCAGRYNDPESEYLEELTENQVDNSYDLSQMENEDFIIEDLDEKN